MVPSSTYTSLIKVKKFSKSFTVTIFFTAILTNGGIGKSIYDSGKGIRKSDI